MERGMHMRKTRCLRPGALRRALTHERIWLKSEELPQDSYRRYYVDIGHIGRLDNNSNHLVSGRRGTGKTHLLGAFQEYINSEKAAEIALMVSILDLSAQDSEISLEAPHTAASSYLAARNLFNQLLRIFFDDFLDMIS